MHVEVCNSKSPNIHPLTYNPPDFTVKSSKISGEIEAFGYFEAETSCVFGEIWFEDLQLNSKALHCLQMSISYTRFGL